MPEKTEIQAQAADQNSPSAAVRLSEPGCSPSSRSLERGAGKVRRNSWKPLVPASKRSGLTCIRSLRDTAKAGTKIHTFYDEKISFDPSNASQKHLTEDLHGIDDFRSSSVIRIVKNPMMTGILSMSHVQMLFSSFVHYLSFWHENLREFCKELLRSFSSPQMRTPELAHSKILLSDDLRNDSSDQLTKGVSFCMNCSASCYIRLFVGATGDCGHFSTVQGVFCHGLSIVSIGENDLLTDKRTQTKALKRRFAHIGRLDSNKSTSPAATVVDQFLGTEMPLSFHYRF